MATMRRLSDADVRAIFESLHGSGLPPPHLKFQIVPVGSNGLKLSPPSYEFEDGLYVLLKPEKKKKKSCSPISASDIPKVPTHLTHYTIKEVPPETCPWSLSGPQFPQPTAIQQRYCYPKGNPEYSSRKGGALWTMYGRDGREDMEFRLLHVYFSAKRAVNKGMTISDDEKKIIEQQVLATTPKKRRKTATAVSRMVRSPWQQRRDDGKGKPAQLSPVSSNGSSSGEYSISGPPRKRAHRSTASMVFDVPGILPPPSPCSYKKRTEMSPHQNKQPRRDSIFVSPHTTGTLSRQGSEDNEDDGFSGHRFHPVASFDEKAKSTTYRSFPSDRAFLTDVFRNPVERKRTGISGDRRNTKGDHHLGASFDINEMEMLDWNDPLLALMMKSSMDHSQAKTNGPYDSCAALGNLLHGMQKTITNGILAKPASDQGAMVSMVANWAKSMAKSPLLLEKVKQENTTSASSTITTPKKSEGQDVTSFAQV